MVLTWMFLSLIFSSSCQKNLLEYKQGDVKVGVEQGSEWLHDFPLFFGIHKKNPPQIAIWLEDMEGNYLSTVYISHKIATQSWQSAGKNRRKEALPHWCHARGIQYADGLYLPTSKEPLTDGISGATPHGSFEVKINPKAKLKQFVVKVEVNHSTDFNEYYTKSAKEGELHYSGGKEGSGQPALVYAAYVNLSSNQNTFTAKLIGHSSADGSNGNLNADLSELTTALHIVERITITIL